jgi:hypothetical protein
MADPSMGLPRQGDLAIKDENDVMGAIAVSGAPSADMDETCAIAALPMISARGAARAAPGAGAKLEPSSRPCSARPPPEPSRASNAPLLQPSTPLPQPNAPTTSPPPATMRTDRNLL